MPTDLVLPLLSKQGQTVIKLAGTFLTHQPGDRIDPIQAYAERFDVGVGTVQAALAYLQQIGAMAIESRGHLGTFIRGLNYPLIWSLSGQGYVVGGMPLPYSRRYEGFATGLYQLFNQSGVALNMVYMRGSLSRLRALANGRFDFVVLSRFAFNNAVDQGLEIEEVLGLGSESYVGQHVVLLRDQSKTQIEDGMRVGIDPSSIDQVLLTKQSCRGKDVEFIEISYMTLTTALEKGQIDATVWNGDDFCASPGAFKAVPLPNEVHTRAKENTEAVIAVQKGNRLMLQVLRSIINRETIRDIQQQVIDNKLSPIY